MYTHTKGVILHSSDTSKSVYICTYSFKAKSITNFKSLLKKKKNHHHLFTKHGFPLQE